MALNLRQFLSNTLLKNKPVTNFCIHPPSAQPNRKGIAAVLIAKDEGKYLWDWLSFHTLAGIDHFIIYHHESSDNSQAIATKFEQSQPKAAITQIPWGMDMYRPQGKRPYHIQQLAYTHAIGTFGAQFKHMTFIDVDEYLVPQPGRSISQSIPDHPLVSLPWVMFGHSGHEHYPNMADPFAYTQRALSQDKALVKRKCIVDPCQIIQVGTHAFQTKTYGSQTAAIERDQGKLNLQLNHYYLRSVQEMVDKYERGNVIRSQAARLKYSILKKRDLIEASTQEDRAASEYLASLGIENSKQLRNHFLADAEKN